MKQDFTEMAGNVLSEMRLLSEGAIVLYEGEAMQLYEQAESLSEAKTAFNDIGKALYFLREQIKMLEAAYEQSTD